MSFRDTLDSMHTVLVNFENGTKNVKPMIDDLKALFWIEGDDDEEWTNTFFQHWGVMEEAYALAASKGLSEVDAPGAAHIRKAVNTLRLEIERRSSSLSSHGAAPRFA